MFFNSLTSLQINVKNKLSMSSQRKKKQLLHWGTQILLNEFNCNLRLVWGNCFKNAFRFFYEL